MCQLSDLHDWGKSWNFLRSVVRLDVKTQKLVRTSLFLSCVVCATLILYLNIFGTDDVEESAVTSYSVGASKLVDKTIGFRNGIHSILGVPVFDTLQGTGDRLPYQGSWGQSIFWPLRTLLGWEHFFLVRSFLFAVPAVFVCIRTLLSWLPKARFTTIIAFGFLISSSFGLYLRWNEWSDQYVQSMGVIAVSMFLMHRDFHIADLNSPFELPWMLFLCLAISSNGVITGHPGFLPVAMAVWLATLFAFIWSPIFRSRLKRWLALMRTGLSLLAAMSIATAISVFVDLLAESGPGFGAARVARTQGLFGAYAFGLYSGSRLGTVPSPLAHLISTFLSTTLMPFFMLFDGIIPSAFRVSSFRELTRVEFSGLLGLLAVAMSWYQIRDLQVRSLIRGVAVLQGAIWFYVLLDARDLLPAWVAASGVWTVFPIILVLNIFLTFVFLARASREQLLKRGLAIFNLLLASYWLLFQFSFVSFGAEFHLPEKYSSRFRVAEAISEAKIFPVSDGSPGRVVITNSKFYNFLDFVALGVPVVAPANPKIRDSRQLQNSYAYYFAVDPPKIDSDEDLARLKSQFAFLNVEKVIIGREAMSSEASRVSGSRHYQLRVSQTDRYHLPDWHLSALDVVSLTQFPAFYLDSYIARNLDTCPILQADCPFFELSVQSEASATPRLRLCPNHCLWTFSSPEIPKSKTLVLPITFDEALRVRDGSSRNLTTVNAGGFLGVLSGSGLANTELRIEFQPDGRTLTRVGASYLNLVTAILLGLIAISKASRESRY